MTRAALIAGAAALVGFAAACASEPPPPRRRPAAAATASRAHPAPAVDRSADVARALGVDPADLIWSASHRAFAVALPRPGGGDAAPRQLRVYGAGGEERGGFAALRPGPLVGLRFLGDDRLVYQVPPAPVPAVHHRKAHAHKPPATQPEAYAIQRVAEGAAPVVCEGGRFVFSPSGDHLAFVAGDPGHESVGVDGTQVYPRSGVTTVQGTPAWSRDGASLALIEGGRKLQLVVLVEVDNPTGDNTWPLPPEAQDPSLHVYWAGVGNIVVGHELTKPVFATSFRRE
jgi:hypothetical protein